jgi:hypothetical protein
MNKDELNPFENFTRLKIPPQRIVGNTNYYPYHNRPSMDSSQFEDEIANYDEFLQNKRCTLFIRRFEYFLRNYYGFVIESENRIYRNYIHFTGIAVIRIYHTVSDLKSLKSYSLRWHGLKTMW